MKFQPSWKSNLLVFTLTISLVVGYFFWQLHSASHQFQKQSHRHSKVLAAVVEMNIESTLLSGAGMEKVAASSLKNSAYFSHYLDTVEPFTQDELTAFAFESGLAGIVVKRPDIVVVGPKGWIDDSSLCEGEQGFDLSPDTSVYLYTVIGEQVEGVAKTCVVVGLSPEVVKEVQQEFSIERLLEKLNNLEGIGYVELRQHAGFDSTIPENIGILKKVGGITVSENYFPMDEFVLVVALKSEHFAKRISQMQREFVLFVLLLCIFGLLSSFFLYRNQKLRLHQAQEFEREMARQHEEAALGRAAATITHEMRNPLNAIGMGLQRLEIEATQLDEEHKRLLVSMREAVGRSDKIISNLKQYTSGFELQRSKISSVELLQQIGTLYEGQFIELNIDFRVDHAVECMLLGDRDLLGQLFENIIKNAMEAQPDGGYLVVSTKADGDKCELRFTNGGCEYLQAEGEKLFQPYYTTKAKGTGLGLPISKKIVEAHRGMTDWEIDEEQNSFTIRVVLPTGV